MIKAILFDADGVTIEQQKNFAEQYSEAYDVPIESILSFFRNDFAPCAIGKADVKDKIQKYLPTWGWEQSVEDLLEYWFSCQNKKDERVLAMVGELRSKGLKCYLATDQERYRTQYILEEMKLGEHFDGTFFSCKLGYQKTDRGFFETILDQMIDVLPKEAMFWDDDEKNVQVASSLGIHAKHYKNFASFSAEMRSFLERT